MKLRLLFILLAVSLQAYSQNDSLKKLTVVAYGEFYYSYDFSNPQNHEKANFLYNHKRHNEINANLLLVKAQYLDQNHRANLGWMTGNFAQYNLAEEPIWAQFIYEANMGIKIAKNQNIWLDAGIMPSHIGFESAVCEDCWTLTRSILAENSPYYETGLKLGYTSKNEKLNIAALYLNGWQKINKPDDIQKPSFGTQLSYKASEKMMFNYSTFLGSDQPDSLHSFRQFHNFYLLYEPTNTFGIISGFDIGRDKFNPGNYGIWYSPVVIIRQKISERTSMALRGEYYNDPKQIIISTGTENGFQTWGISSNINCRINSKIKWSIEGKIYRSKDTIFENKDYNYSITTHMTIKL